MIISHELPNTLLNELDIYNDYHYLLPTLWEKYKDYRDFYKTNKKWTILDNGLFENGNYTDSQLIAYVNNIKPNVFVVPDVWDDHTQTLKNAKYWINTLSQHLESTVKLMAVIQGQDNYDAILLYNKLLDLGYECIAFTHNSKIYTKGHNYYNHLLTQQAGRINLIELLHHKQYINESVHHHLLGCSLPQEISVYKNYPFIKSIDTSNPIIHGIEGKRYSENGILYKSKAKIEDFFNKDLSLFVEDIKFNIEMFKNFNK